MDQIRALFRIGQKADAVRGAVHRPIYPPEDKLKFGLEEVAVTLVLSILSYAILSTPCFAIRRPARRRLEYCLNAFGWMEAARQLQHVRSVDDAKRWWRQVRRGDGDRITYDSHRWGELVQSRNSIGRDESYHADRTIRAKGGRSACSSPLRSFFLPAANKQNIHVSTSDGHLVESPAKVQRISADGKYEVESFYTEELFPETDHDLFEKAWRSHIRFAEYRQLVLPPECKLVRFTTTLREVEQSLLENFLDESRYNKIMSQVRNVHDVLHGSIAKLLSKVSIKQFSVWVLGLFRYRLRRQQGLPVEEDETDDDDDASVATHASSFAVRPSSKRPPSHKLTEKTPVASLQKTLFESSGISVTGDNPPLDFVPQLASSANPKENVQGNADDSSSTNVSQVKSPEKKDVRHVDRVPFLPPSSNASELNDDATFVSASALEQIDASLRSLDIPPSVEHLPKIVANISPLPTAKIFVKQKRRDSLESYRKPDMKPASLHSLKPTPKPHPKLVEKIPSVPSPQFKPRNADAGSSEPPTMNFFDTANSDSQLRDMSRAVPIPDSNGFILGDEFLSPSCTPLLVFVNPRSGPQQGHLLITQFRRLLNPIQVCDLASGGPEKILKSFSVLSRFQLLVCGGDGTVSWIISALEKMGLKRWPPIGILPLGTGNDLARIHGWGGGYNNESLLFILHQISEAYISMLDLWELDITSTSKNGKQRKEVKPFINYLGVGVDAQAALQVHNLRESKPTLFFSRFFNKAWYAIAGGEEAFKSSCANLSQEIALMADGIEIPLPPDSQGIIFLNIDSYSGGVSMWSKGLKPRNKRVRRYSEGDFFHPNPVGLTRNDSIDDVLELESSRELELTNCDIPSSPQDGLLDVVSIRGAFHLGQIRVGLSNAQLLCQCKEATVTLKKKVAIQIDGEPWRQNPSTLQIIRKLNRANMLNRPAKESGGVETEVTKLLNWANERGVIDQKQYALLMEEFSRRIEYKKQKQKERGSGFSFAGKIGYVGHC